MIHQNLIELYLYGGLFVVGQHGLSTLSDGLCGHPRTYLPYLPGGDTVTQFGGFGELSGLDHPP